MTCFFRFECHIQLKDVILDYVIPNISLYHITDLYFDNYNRFTFVCYSKRESHLAWSRDTVT